MSSQGHSKGTAAGRMKFMTTWVTLIGVTVGVAPGESTQTPDQIAEWTKSSAFVFMGTVKAAHKSNVSSLPDSQDKMVVSVDKVQSVNPRSESSLGAWVGKQITVISERSAMPIPALKEGDHAIFFTNPRVYGENVAVALVGVVEDKAPTGGFARVMSQVAIAAEEKSDSRLKAAIDSADAVVTGKVVAVRPLAAPKVRALAMATEKGQPITHHDPKWQEAVINVESVEKGDSSQKQAIVVFPGTDDVAWADQPKFKEGDAGTWILHKNQIEERQARALLAPEKIAEKEIQTYTALKKEDFHPLDADGKNQTRIRRMIDASKP